MTELSFQAMPSETAGAYRCGAPDANGQAPERRVSDGFGVDCRHCLREVAAGEPYLILAYRPFPAAQPYAEIGPIFLHAEACPRHETAGDVPPLFLARDHLLVRGYGADDRIVYGTGEVVASADLADTAGRLLARPEVAYLHLRSAANNCFQCRIDRA